MLPKTKILKFNGSKGLNINVTLLPNILIKSIIESTIYTTYYI